ncbi:type I-E CRISPR-associated protein Cas7/Cse4/CasC [Nordella sp. HKS 07]|uniref:type I-E CRISPR-associated protein Cas7/Cse4/CasC n=1 Tax=Nordella sp. HKS 07 TaxID=2712222 RepID=UPI0013E106D4|nr:type I-E CRISPR-associated protein Cas7/Cse4/CasC [Nordella sp. HKS 07]QIG47923.1 type I-E CRISPR-associated protein Cas7/Cse4/CasC [Nordella sp. HKS 07]
MFVQIHTLRDYSTALPNRGQDGLAKRTVYGGIERQRISSQSFKAALRDSKTLVRTAHDGSTVDDTLRALANGCGIGMSIRSALIEERIVLPKLMEKGFSEEEAKTWANAIMGLWRKADAAVASDTPLVVGEKEVDALVRAATLLKVAGTDTKEFRNMIEKPQARNKAPEAVRQAIENMRAIKANAGMDGALFGRFATGVAVDNVDSAVHVAHLVTVHPLFSVTDFFSVQDLLKTGQGEDRGGSHINTAELTSGLFYGYVVVDLRQLEENFASLDSAQRGAIVAWLIRAVAQVEPAAKLGSTAPYSCLRELMVEIGRRQPRSLIGAFENPVDRTSERSLSEEARARLIAHAAEMDALTGKSGWRVLLREHTGGTLPAVEALSDAAAKYLRAA